MLRSISSRSRSSTSPSVGVAIARVHSTRAPPCYTAPMEINGMAHVILTVRDFPAARAFYGALLPFLGLTPVVDSPRVLLLRRRADRARDPPGDPARAGEAFSQERSGLHHLCFRARTREDVDTVHAFPGRARAQIVHGPEEGGCAPGYYSVLFEDPRGHPARGELRARARPARAGRAARRVSDAGGQGEQLQLLRSAKFDWAQTLAMRARGRGHRVPSHRGGGDGAPRSRSARCTCRRPSSSARARSTARSCSSCSRTCRTTSTRPGSTPVGVPPARSRCSRARRRVASCGLALIDAAE